MSQQQLIDEFNAADFVNLALSSARSSFGRLVLLVDLTDHDTDPLAAQLYGKEQIDAALERKHGEVFLTWLSLSHSARVDEVAEYLTEQSGNQESASAERVHRWTQEKLQEKLSPKLATEPERKCFSSELGAIFQLLQVGLNSSGWPRGG
jgi:hypothetical protein